MTFKGIFKFRKSTTNNINKDAETIIPELLTIDKVEEIFNSTIRTEAIVKVILKQEAKRQARFNPFVSWKTIYNRLLDESKLEIDKLAEIMDKYISR
jgi:hypothetical protein